jgi:hypothetical protein
MENIREIRKHLDLNDSAKIVYKKLWNEGKAL